MNSQDNSPATESIYAELARAGVPPGDLLPPLPVERRRRRLWRRLILLLVVVLTLAVVVVALESGQQRDSRQAPTSQGPAYDTQIDQLQSRLRALEDQVAHLEQPTGSPTPVDSLTIADIRVAEAPATVESRQATNIRVELVDQDGNLYRTAEPVEIVFRVDKGILATDSTSGNEVTVNVNNGQAEVTFFAGTEPGSTTIVVSTEGITRLITIEITMPITATVAVTETPTVTPSPTVTPPPTPLPCPGTLRSERKLHSLDLLGIIVSIPAGTCVSPTERTRETSYVVKDGTTFTTTWVETVVIGWVEKRVIQDNALAGEPDVSLIYFGAPGDMNLAQPFGDKASGTPIDRLGDSDDGMYVLIEFVGQLQLDQIDTTTSP